MGLSRNDMEQIIRDGGSVLHGGRILSRIEELPNDATLAKGDPAKEAAAVSAIEAQMAALQSQLDQLAANQAKPASEPDAGQANTPPADETPDQKSGEKPKKG